MARSRFLVALLGAVVGLGVSAAPGWAAAPETTIVSHPASPTRSTSARFAFTSSVYGSSFRCWIDHGAGQPCTSPRVYDGLAEGWHGFAVAAIDPAGNVDPTPARFFWRIDLTPPETTISSHPPDPSGSTDAGFAFASSEPGSSFQCRLDAGSWTGCTSPQAYSGLAEGTHSFRVRAFDAAGNWDATPAGYDWQVSLATITWTGAAGSNDWGTAGNWTPARLPADGDRVLIPAGAAGLPVVYAAGTSTIDSLDAGGALTVSGGVLTLAGPEASTLSTLTLGYGEFDVNGAQAATVTSLSTAPYQEGYPAPTLGGTGTLVITRGLNWRSGQMAGPGQTVVAADAKVAIMALYLQDRRQMLNEGDATCNGLLWLGLFTSFTNAGSLSLEGTGWGVIEGWNSFGFSNTGSVQIARPPGYPDVYIEVGGVDTGSYSIPAGFGLAFFGERTLAAGASVGGDGWLGVEAAVSVLTGAQIDVGSLGIGGLCSPVCGQLSLLPGSTVRAGSFAQVGTLETTIAGDTPGSGFAQLQVSGNADLAGTLRIVTDPGFHPAAGQTFPIITYASHTGAYATVEGTDLGGGLSYQLGYGPTALTLTAVQQ